MLEGEQLGQFQPQPESTNQAPAESVNGLAKFKADIERLPEEKKAEILEIKGEIDKLLELQDDNIKFWGEKAKGLRESFKKVTEHLSPADLNDLVEYYKSQDIGVQVTSDFIGDPSMVSRDEYAHKKSGLDIYVFDNLSAHLMEQKRSREEYEEKYGTDLS